MSLHTNGATNNGAVHHATETEVTPTRAKRRSFTAKQKIQILTEVDQLPHGELGAYLRRKGIYSSSVSTWKKQRDEGLLSSKAAPQRGPAPRSSESKNLERLERENAKLRKKLEQADMIIAAQKKLCEIYGQNRPASKDGHK
ncbi:MAG: transposase [Dehalococcoidia bacterium]|nr:transposase [Dehalococcoidia bacterium]